MPQEACSWVRALLVGCALLLAAPVHALTLEQGRDSYRWAEGLQMWLDPTGQADLEQARAASYVAVDGEPNFGFRSEAFWFRGEFVNASHLQAQWILWIEYALLDSAELYLIDSRGEVERLATGDHLPFDSRHVSHRHLNFGFEIPRGETKQFFLRARSSSSVQVAAKLVTPKVFAESAYLEELGFGLLYGAFAALMLYNLILYIAMRDITFLYYVLYVASFAFFQSILNGFAFQYLWPNSPAWGNLALVFFMPVIFFAMCQFCRSFLELERNAPLFDTLFKGLMVLFALLVAASLFVDYQTLVRIETGSVFLLMATIIGAVVSSIRVGYRPALYFAIAWAVLIGGIILYASVSFGALPKMFITEYGFQLGSVAEMILLSFALAYRINILREENTRITEEANQMLERRVEERTRDLNRALIELGEANKRLEQTSMLDGLTGVHNRRYLDQALRDSWRGAVEEGQWLALIVLDLDHFKTVNDKLGHLAGDDCLRSVANCVRGLLDELEATFARFGGEEFFIVLPDRSIEDARLLAEAMRKAIAKLEIESAEHRFKVTASFGVAALRPDHSADHNELIQRADDAMYEAKQGGRNRVVTAAPKVVGGN